MTRRLRSVTVLAAVLFCGVVASVPSAQETPPQQDSAPQLERSDRPSLRSKSDRVDERSIETAIRRLSDTKFSRRQVAYLFLIECGKDAIASLEHAAGDDDFNVAERCVRALAEITRDSECTEAALMALDRLAADDTKRVAKLAASESKRLRMTKEELAVEALIAAGVRVQRSTRGAIYSLQISRDEDLFWLKFLPRLRRVNLSGNGITDGGLKHLFDCKQLTDLSFAGTAVTDAGLAQLQHLPALTGLHLLDNHFSADGIRQLKGVKGLSSLSWFSPIDIESLRAVGELQRLTSFSLSTKQVTEDLIDVISRLTQLTKLHLSATDLTDEQCEHLARIKTATYLSLMRSPELTLAGWEHLGRMDLHSLSTYQSPITDAGMKCLGAARELKYLTISDSPVSDEGLLHLKELTNLRYINLRATNVTQSGADRLKELLPNLRTLRIDSPGFTPAKAYSVTTAIDKKNVHLRTALTDATLKELRQEKDVHTVFMTRINSNDQQIRMIATLPIKGLVIDSDVVTDQGLAALKAHPHLQSLTVTSSRLTDECKDAILAIPSLSKLWLQKAQLSDAGVQALITGMCDKQQLNSLNFGSCPQITNQAFDGIAELESLTQLTLRDNPQLDSGVFRFVRELPGLTEIRLEGNVVEAADLEHLGTLRLERLHLSNARIADGVMAALVKACPDLKQLGVAKSNLDDAAMAPIGKLKQLEWLWLYGTSISDDGLAELDDLKNLKNVYVSADSVTALGQQRFQKQHPAATLRRN
ncbi:hypothetical protein NZK35_25745 [Stieleria sp. ICT_E10.1]|uniref:leucine-rich repeat domain-containing protein n=1 Tax=Stieleria sedimenti TaxID=2976331 RepID=UPI0021800302|nr:hypothetical protein [Stieleria sedimenti]MCS7470062.1 hypothetical protein [Stieleria sedimenti]